jgi:hypothetical protein
MVDGMMIYRAAIAKGSGLFGARTVWGSNTGSNFCVQYYGPPTRFALQPEFSILTLHARVVYYPHGCHTIGPPPATFFNSRSQYFLNKQRPII